MIACFVQTPAIMYFINGAVVLGLAIYLSRYGTRSSTIIWLRTFLVLSAIYNISNGFIRCAQSNEVFNLLLVAYGFANALMIPALLIFAFHFVNKDHILNNTYMRAFIALLGGGLLYALWATDLLLSHDMSEASLQFGNLVIGAGSQSQLFGTILLLGYIAPSIIIWRYSRHLEDKAKKKEVRIVLWALSLLVVPGTIIEGIVPIVFQTYTLPTTPLTTVACAIMLTYAITRYGVHVFSLNNVTGNIMQVMPGGLIILDHTNTIQYVNAGAANALGYDASQLAGASAKKLFHATSEYERFEAHILGQLAPGHSITGQEAKLTTKSKQPLAISLNAVSVYSGRDLINRIITFTDITRLKQTEAELEKEKASVERKVVERTEQLQTEQAKLKASIESLNIGFVMIDANDNVILTNQALASVLGPTSEPWSVESIAGRIEAGSGERQNPLDYLDEVRHSQEPVFIEHANAGNKIIRIFIAPVEFKPGSVGIVAVLEDITEREILNRSKDEFFSIASHELRTPLTAIRGNASMLLSVFGDQIKNPDAHEMIDDIHQSSLRLIGIVNDFLDLSRLEQGKVTFEYEAVKLDEVIESVVYEMNAMLQEKHLSLGFNHKTLGELPQAWADKNRLKQVIYNMVGNAAKFTDQGGITIQADVAGDKLKVQVIDTGRGISKDGQKLLFHKFQQAGNSLITRDTARGTGLGLYISKILTESMGGVMALEYSHEGKGSSFSFTIPLASSHHETKATATAPGHVDTIIDAATGLAASQSPDRAAMIPPAPRAASDTKTSAPVPAAGKLLVIEDDPYVLRLYQRLFSSANFALETALDGKRGYELAQEFQPDLILLDMMMPVMNGLETLKALKKDPKTRDIPVVILSNFGEEPVVKQVLESGATSYLIKSSFSPEQLLEAVKDKLVATKNASK